MTTPLARVGLAAGVLAVALACGGPAAAAPAIAQSEAFDQTMDLYDQGKWSAAYRGFARLADAGQPEAAAIALLMLRHGVRLYGHQWSASPAQTEHWMELALRTMEAAAAKGRD